MQQINKEHNETVGKTATSCSLARRARVIQDIVSETTVVFTEVSKTVFKPVPDTN